MPTERLNLYNTIKDMLIANVEMIGKCKNVLINIEVGRVEGGFFYTETRNYTIKCTEELYYQQFRKHKNRCQKN